MKIAIPKNKWNEPTSQLPGIDARILLIAEEFDKLGCFHGVDDEELRNRLLEIKGVGNKTMNRFMGLLMAVGGGSYKRDLRLDTEFRFWRSQQELACLKEKLRRLEKIK